MSQQPRAAQPYVGPRQGNTVPAAYGAASTTTSTVAQALEIAKKRYAEMQVTKTAAAKLPAQLDAVSTGIPPVLLESLASKERIRALARLVDMDVELEDDAIELIDEVLGAWVDEVTVHAADISRLHKRRAGTAPVLTAADMHASVRDAYPMVVLPTDSLIQHRKPKAPPMELIRRERAAASASIAAVQASLSAEGTASSTVQLAPVAITVGAGTDSEAGRKRPRAAGRPLLSTGNATPLFDPTTGEPMKRPRGRPTNLWRAAEEAARAAAEAQGSRQGTGAGAGAGTSKKQ